MKTRVLLFLIFAVTAFAIGSLITTLFNTAPNATDVFILFYTSLVFSIFGLVFFGLYGYFYLRFQAIPDWQSTTLSLRLGGILGLFCAAALAIQSLKLLNTATFVILVILAIASELILRRRITMKQR